MGKSWQPEISPFPLVGVTEKSIPIKHPPLPIASHQCICCTCSAPSTCSCVVCLLRIWLNPHLHPGVRATLPALVFECSIQRKVHWHFLPSMAEFTIDALMILSEKSVQCSLFYPNLFFFLKNWCNVLKSVISQMPSSLVPDPLKNAALSLDCYPSAII